MVRGNWEQVKDIFFGAMRQPVEKRADFLDQVCQNNIGLRRELESLLSSSNKAQSFLESPLLYQVAEVSENDRTELRSGESFGHYRIIRQIGVGGMGDVYLAEDTILKRDVALKLMPRNILSSKVHVQRFKQEARAASALNHPNILTVYEIGSDDSFHFISTEYVEGENLRERMNRSAIEIDEALGIAVQIASALAIAHENGIIHRDIKPENIMIRHDGLVKILDFGLAKLIDKPPKKKVGTQLSTDSAVHTPAGLILGTPGYMSPEQVRGKETDVRTDIWSLGCVLYEMLAGKMPFSGETSSDALAAILMKVPLALSDYDSNIPKELDRIVNKALQKNLKERYQLTKDLLTELKAVKDDLEFAAKWERSDAPSKVNKEKTNKHEAATKLLVLRDTFAHKYLYGAIKRHKSGSLATFAILLLAVLSLGAWYLLNPFPGTTYLDSIAVLPFENATGNAETEYISDGITESLINSLTGLPQLRVIARPTAFNYKGKVADPRSVGRELKVRAVLTGRVRQNGDRLSIQVDLVDTATGAQLWGEVYERPVSDILPIKQLITREVIENLKLKLSGAQQQNLVKQEPTNKEAYEFYLRGSYLLGSEDPRNFKKASEQFQRAIDYDPNYALAYVGLANSYTTKGIYDPTKSSEWLPKARAAVERALQIDDSLAEAYIALGTVEMQSWNFSEAEKGFKRAVELNPNYSIAHVMYSLILAKRGKLDDAFAELKRAQQLEMMGTEHLECWLYFAIGDTDTVIEIANNPKTLELHPNFHSVHFTLGLAYRKQGRYDEAIAEFEKGMAINGNRGGGFLIQLGICHALAGRTSEARSILKEAEALYEKRKLHGRQVANLYAALGDKEQAFAHLEKDFQARSVILPDIAFDPMSDVMREILGSDPRWDNLLRRMGLEPR